MGNGSNFFSRDEKGRRSEYVSLEPARIVNGVKGHLIKKVGDSDTHTNLPFYSNTSDLYFRQNENGVCQARVFIGQKTYLDFDWSHTHINKGNGRKFERGTVHVQVWKQNKDGTYTRVTEDRRMNNAEMKKYGHIFKDYCLSVKLR